MKNTNKSVLRFLTRNKRDSFDEVGLAVAKHGLYSAQVDRALIKYKAQKTKKQVKNLPDLTDFWCEQTTQGVCKDLIINIAALTTIAMVVIFAAL